MSVRKEGNILKCTGGEKLWGDAETVETWELCLSHSLDNSTERNFQSYKRRLSDCSVCLCGISKPGPSRRDKEGRAERFAREQHKCQPVGEIQYRLLPVGRIVNRKRQFRIETMA